MKYLFTLLLTMGYLSFSLAQVRPAIFAPPSNDIPVSPHAEGFSSILATQNDAGVLTLVSPTPPTSTGFASVEVEVMNYASQPLTAFTIEWEVNGVAQTPVPYYGTPLANGETAIITLGNLNVPPSTVDLSFWTTMPNGVMDEDLSNDTLQASICSPLAGTYTVGHPTADFPTATAALDALENCGVAGAVTLEFQAGTYTGPWTIGAIPGASATNTVTFDGLDRTITTLTHNSTGGAATILLDGANYVTIQNFTIENTGTFTAYGVLLTNEANYNTINNNAINMVVGSAYNVVGILASASLTRSTGYQTEGNNANWNIIRNNDISGGRTSITFEGGERDSFNVGNQFINNQLHNANNYGIYVDEQDSLVVEGNIIYDLGSSGSDAIELHDVPNVKVTKNKISGSQDNGIAVNGSYSSPTANVFIANNFVEAGYDALHLVYVADVQVYHNTLVGENRAVYLSGQQNLDLRNNILATTSGTCFYTTSSTVIANMDYNLYYIAGSGNVIRFGSTTYQTLVDWQTTGVSRYEANAVTGNPNFVNGLHIASTLPIDAGDPTVTLAEDIDGEMRPMGTAPDIGADERQLIPYDVMVSNLVSPEGCGDTSAAVIIEITNLGINPIINAPVIVNITGGANSTFVTTLPNIAGNTTTQLNVGNLNTTTGGVYNFEIVIDAAQDTDASNDTLRKSVMIYPDNQNALTFTGNDTICLGGAATIEATPLYNSSASVVWYDAPIAGNIVNVGNVFTIDTLTARVTYYAEIQGCNAARAVKSIEIDSVGINVDLGADLTACGGTLVTITPTITNAIATAMEWQDGALTTTYDAGVSGDYYVTVTNANGCTDTDTVNVSLSPMPSIVDLITDVSCANAADGVIDLTVTNGVGPYSYNWDNGDTTNSINGLNGGFYVVTIVDSGTASNCAYIKTYEVTESTVLTANVDNTTIDCEGTGATVNITVLGGNPNYTYVWSTGATTEDLPAAPAGTHTVTVTDANGCSVNATTTVVTSNPIVITVDSIYPEIVDVQGGIEITVTGGSNSSNLRYSWNTGATTDDLMDLVAGTYTVTVTDVATGCQKVLSGIVVPYQLPNSIGQLENVASLDVYPNPTAGKVWVNLDLTKNTTVQLSITSITGQLVQAFEPNEQLQQNYLVDLTNYPAGVYLARFIIDKEVKTIKLIVE